MGNKKTKENGAGVRKVSEVYKKLYHYTNWDGLLGILQSQTLWGTHYKFLNDYSEIRLFRDRLIDLLYPHILEEVLKKTPVIQKNLSAINNNKLIEEVIKREVAKFVDIKYEATGEEIYIASFCGETKNPYIDKNGLLSQWRGYGTDGGFVLEFDTLELERIIALESEKFCYDTGYIADIIYSDNQEKFQLELSDQLNDIALYMKEIFLHRALDENNAPDATKAYPAFVQCISRYKHCAFKEENEVRIVALPTTKDEEFLELARKTNSETEPEKERKFRQKNGEHVPYIEFFNSPELILPIERIIIGPHKEKENRAAALRTMLRNTNIDITVSDIPYIG